MDSNYGENLKQALLKLQESLNDLITNTYLSGFQYGQELGLKVNEREDNTIVEDKFTNFVSGIESQKSSALLESEKILRDCS